MVALGHSLTEHFLYLNLFSTDNQNPRGTADAGSHAKHRFADYKARHHRGPFCFEGHFYDSRSEAACAKLMTKYIAGWRVVNGRTMQVPLSRNEHGAMRFCDFKVADVLFEYHPPRIWRTTSAKGDFASNKDLADFLRNRAEAKNAEDRKALIREAMWHLTDLYRRKRLEAISASAVHHGKELVIAISPEEFYLKVLCRFATAPLPSLKCVLSEFYKILWQVKETRPVASRTRSRMCK